MITLRPPPPPNQFFYIIKTKDDQIVTHVYRGNRYLCLFSNKKEPSRLLEEMDIKDTAKLQYVSWGNVVPYFSRYFDGVVLNYSIDSPHVEFLLFDELKNRLTK